MTDKKNSQNVVNESRVINNSQATPIDEDAALFERLLEGSNDNSQFEKITAMITYAQYVLQKHQFIQQYRKEEGKEPSDEHLRMIILSFKNENSVVLNGLKEISENLLKIMLKNMQLNTKKTDKRI